MSDKDQALISKEAVEFTLDKFDGYMQSVGEVIKQYAPDALDLGLAALRVDAASSILPALVATIIFAIIARVSWKKRKYMFDPPVNLQDLVERGYRGRGQTQDTIVARFTGSRHTDVWREKYNIPVEDKEAFEYIFPVVVCVISSAISIICLTHVMNIWAWIGLFYPEVYAVHKFLM